MAIDINDKAPTLLCLTRMEKKFRSRIFAENMSLYFYPRADTPGCTIEACEFRDS
jgi:peroxiredoxin Q/BCP